MTDTINGIAKATRGTTAQWASSLTPLEEGELGYNTETGAVKIGDARSLWGDLPALVQTDPATGKLPDTVLASMAADLLDPSTVLGAAVSEDVNLPFDDITALYKSDSSNPIPSVSADTKQLPDEVRATIAANFADESTVEGAYLAGFVRPRQVVDVAFGDGLTDASDHINGKIQAALAAGGGKVEFPDGTYLCKSRINLASGVHLSGKNANVTLKAGTGLANGVIVGVSGTAVSDVLIEGIRVDGSYSDLSINLPGIQVSNSNRVRIRDVEVFNAGGPGIAFLQSGTGVSTLNEVSNSYIHNNGAGSPTTGFGILLSGSNDAKIFDNTIIDNTCMNIGGNTAALRAKVSGNHLEKTAAISAYENIGWTAGCTGWQVVNNKSLGSRDNGISASGDYCVVSDNWIDSPQFHGIALIGAHSIVNGNWIRNPGQAAAGTYSGIRVQDGNNTVVANNRLYDDQGAGNQTMYRGITELNNSTNMRYENNRITGMSSVEYLLASSSTSQHVSPRLMTSVTVSAAASVSTDAATTELRRLNITASGVAITISAPTNPFVAAEMTYLFVNASSGDVGTVTWNSVFKLGGTVTFPASGATRAIRFRFDGTNWIETGRSAADVS